MGHVSRGKGRLVAFALGLAVLALGGATVAFADDPVPAIIDQCTADDVVVALFEVQPGMASDFLNAMVASSHYHSNRAQRATVVNETISQGIVEEGRPERFFAVTSMHNRKAVNAMKKDRNRAVANAVTRQPQYITAKVIEHLLANWGLEKGSAISFQRVTPSGHSDGPAPTENYGTSLAFFKTGYAGQMSMLEKFKSGTSLDAVRADLTSRKGMSGASIYLDTETNTYYAYSEYFDLGATTLSDRNVADRRFGPVVENFQAR